MNDEIDYIGEDETQNASVPMFPGPSSIKKVWRHLAKGKLGDDGCFNVEHKVREYRFIASHLTYDDMVQDIFALNLLTFVDKLSTFPFLDEAIQDPQATILCTNPKRSDPSILSIRIKRKNETRWIVPITVWDLEHTWESIELLDNFYRYMGSGTYPTPGSLGHAMMKEQWRRLNLPRHTVLNGRADAYLREHRVGGRCDTPGLGQAYEKTLELDRGSAYLAEYERHPTGAASWFKHGFCDNYVTYFARCSVSISKNLPLGPFPVRIWDNKFKSHLEYPSSPGMYEAFLWKEQVEECRSRDCGVFVHEGYGWYEFTHDNIPWAKLMYFKKQEASKEMEPLVKQVIVKAIGRHAMENKLYILIPESQYQEGDIAIGEDSAFYLYFVRERIDTSSTNMLHWNIYTVDMCNLDLFRFAYHFAVDNRLILTNYDSVMVVPREEDYIRWQTKEQSRKYVVGAWGWTELHNVRIVAPRSYESDEKIVRPGVEKENK